MKVLIINNGTKHLTALEHMLSGNKLTLEEFNQVHPPVEGFDLVILSGSSLYSVIEKPEIYKNEIKIIKESRTPIIGICLGCELIAYTFGATLNKLPEREHGITKIKSLDGNFIENGEEFRAYEAHEWAIKRLSKKLKAFAQSKDGFEIIKVKDRDIFGLQFHPEMLRGRIDGSEVFFKIVNLICK